MLNNFSKNSPSVPRHSRRRVDSSSKYETHWTGLSTPSREREMDFQLFGTRYYATGPALQTRTAKSTVCTAGCKLVLHSGNLHGVTASVSSSSYGCVLHADTPLQRHGAPQRNQLLATTVRSGLGISASTTMDGVYCRYNGVLCGTCVQSPARTDPRAAVKQVSAKLQSNRVGPCALSSTI